VRRQQPLDPVPQPRAILDQGLALPLEVAPIFVGLARHAHDVPDPPPPGVMAQ
jgi:hypothetical protein